ncbi:hypothetical protein [Lysinibacillus sp. RS5]|uniref:hypothetical protein n=1 Tax=unclassified Lysinibacillus TaxID=2636778 RepID=UPI0035BE1BBD
MKKLFYIGALSVLLLTACGEEEAKPKEETPVAEDHSKTVDENELKDYASNIKAGMFVKNISLTDNYSVIEYYANFDEYKIDNTDNYLTVDDYKIFFDTEETIEKILVIENVDLLRQFPELTGAKMTLPFDGKTYSIDIDRSSVNEYLGFKVEDLKTEDSWTTKFVNPIGNDDQKRQDFMKKFGKIN